MVLSSPLVVDTITGSPYLMLALGAIVLAAVLSILSGLIDIAVTLLIVVGVVLLVLFGYNLVTSYFVVSPVFQV